MSSDTESAPARVKVDLGQLAPAMTHWNQIDELREEHRFFWAEQGQGYWVLTRYEDIREAFQTPEVFCNHSIVPTDPDPAYRFLPSFSTRRCTWPTAAPMNPWFSPARWPSSSRACASWRERRSSGWSPTARATTWRRFGDRFPVAGFLASMGLPQDDADFFVSMRPPHGSDQRQPGTPPSRCGGVGRARRLLGRDARRPPPAPARPGRRLHDHMSQSKLDDEPMPDADILDITRHAHAREPRHAEEPARLAACATSPPTPTTAPASSPTRRSSRMRSRSSCAPTRSCSMARKVTQRRRLPRLPDEEGRHGPAHHPGRHP